MTNETLPAPVALTIAGCDPSGGAGILADIQTFAKLGCRATAAVTSLTFQNANGVFGAAHQTAETVREQVRPVAQGYRVAALKTGMLPTRAVVEEVARLCRETELPAPVVDTVIRSTSGYDLLDAAALRALVTQLFPLARVITPNVTEAERITGLVIRNAEDLPRAAYALRDLGARAVLVKGGHLSLLMADNGLRLARDVLFEDGKITVFDGEWIESRHTRGTGCTLSAAIAAGLAHQLPLSEAVRQAKLLVADKLRGKYSKMQNDER